jgi:hypothetical protein
MPLSWTEIKTRAARFAKRHQSARHERSEAQTFWNEFFSDVFGIERRRVAVFESKVARLAKKRPGFMDLFWPGVVLIEHKSAGEDLEIAQRQAEDYFLGLKDGEHPRFLLACDFQNFWLRDLDSGDETRFTLAQLPQNISSFAFLLGQQVTRVSAQDPVNEKAVKKLSRLHDALRHDGYDGHALQLLLVRMLFCLFADKTGIFEPKDRFLDLIERGTKEDGSDLGAVLLQLFDVLNVSAAKRQKSLSPWFTEFPHVNGALFSETLRIPSFSSEMRDMLLDCCRIDWSRISPAIFGSMFQRIVDLESLDDKVDLRRQLGAHYTSEENILRLIRPLFLDDLEAEFGRVSGSKNKLFEFQKKLRSLFFLDPACGCGNFLVVTYRELRRLEMKVLEAAQRFGVHIASPFEAMQVDVDQFSGIEIEEFPAQVAQVAMWLMDHQMNIEAGRLLDAWLPRIPLRASAHVRIGNALSLDWADFCPPGRLDYILGNPPFIGKQQKTAEQKADLERVLSSAGIKGGGVLDYVAAWYVRAAQYLAGSKASSADQRKREFVDAQFRQKAKQADWLADVESQLASSSDIFELAENQDRDHRARVRVAFVSTNSICQGEQVAPLWGWLLKEGVHVDFAHRTFRWSNDASGQAAVHCVIIGLGIRPRGRLRLFDYVQPDGEPVESTPKNINPYLVDAVNVLVASRRRPIVDAPPIVFGSMANDGGHLLLDADEHAELLSVEPDAMPWVRRFLGAEEFLNDKPRWCLWLKDCPPQTLARMPAVRRRIALVKAHRLASKRPATQRLAESPQLFGEIRQPSGRYLLVPRHSSERREIIPIGFMPAEVIVGDANLCIPSGGLYHLGVLSSAMHMAWVKHVCGRLESRYRYTNQIVYNNFPWPDPVDDLKGKHRAAVEAAAQSMLDARAAHTGASLAHLYDPDTLPADLLRAHRALDAAVDAAYQWRGGKADMVRAAMLFARYDALTRNMAAEPEADYVTEGGEDDDA